MLSNSQYTQYTLKALEIIFTMTLLYKALLLNGQKAFQMFTQACHSLHGQMCVGGSGKKCRKYYTSNICRRFYFPFRQLIVGG